MTGLDAEALIMTVSGLLVSVAVPAVLLATRERGVWGQVSLPWVVALPLFAVLHAGVTLAGPLVASRLYLRLVLEAVLLCGAAVFWLPVVGTRHRLSDPARSVYLYLAMPVLDLPVVVMIARGHVVGGLAMIVTMLPIGLAALAITWRWINAEERLTKAGSGVA
ncbi:hypothetical protein ACYF6T_40140 [Streptomyces sp. 7R007]